MAIPTSGTFDYVITVPFSEVATIFKERDPSFDTWDFPETPVELQIGAHRLIRYRGRFELEGYEVMVMHGSYPGRDSKHECVAIARTNACNPTPVIQSAYLLDLDGLKINK